MYLLIGKTDHGVADFLQVCRPRIVVLNLDSVAIPVDLDHKFGAGTAKVHDETPDRMLPSGLEAKQLLASQPGPQFLLRRCLLAPEFFGALLDSLAGAPAFVVGHIAYPPRFAGGRSTLRLTRACPPPVKRGKLEGGVRWVTDGERAKGDCARHAPALRRHPTYGLTSLPV